LLGARHDEAREIARGDLAQRAVAEVWIDPSQVLDFSGAEYLDPVRMDEVQVADQAFGRNFDEIAVQILAAALAARRPRELQLFTIVLKQPGYAETRHEAAIA
jgi:hypothetical protein